MSKNLNLKDELVSLLQENVSKDIVVDKVKETLPTTISLLDAILSGGIVIGDMTMLVGKPGSGKSSLAAQIGASLIRSNKDALAIYIDTEQSFTKTRLEQLNVPLERSMVISNDVSLEKVFMILTQIFKLKEENDLIDVPFLVVWDSVAATGSERASEVDRMEQMTGYEAKFISFALKSYIREISKYNIIFVTVNQLRDKINVNAYNTSSDLRWLGNKDVYGGNMLKYLAFTLLYMAPTSPDFVSDNKNGNGLVSGFDGTTIRVFAVKNKLMRPNIKIDLVFDYNRGFRDDWTRLMFLKDRKKINSGSWWKVNDIDKKFRLRDFESLYESDMDFRNKFDEIYENELSLFVAELKKEISVSSDKEKVEEIEEKEEKEN